MPFLQADTDAAAAAAAGPEPVLSLQTKTAAAVLGVEGAAVTVSEAAHGSPPGDGAVGTSMAPVPSCPMLVPLLQEAEPAATVLGGESAVMTAAVAVLVPTSAPSVHVESERDAGVGGDGTAAADKAAAVSSHSPALPLQPEPEAGGFCEGASAAVAATEPCSPLHLLLPDASGPGSEGDTVTAAAAAPGSAGKKTREPGTIEVEQFTKV